MGVLSKIFRRKKTVGAGLAPAQKKDVGPGLTTDAKKVSPKDFRVLKEPHISERATALTKQNKYVFKVKTKANRVEIKKEVERLYNVDVINVNIINLPRKPRRLGRTKGFRSGFKKAIITLKHGQKITQTKT